MKRAGGVRHQFTFHSSANPGHELFGQTTYICVCARVCVCIVLAVWINIHYTGIVIGVTGNANLNVTLLV